MLLAPATPTRIESLPSASNLLHASVETITSTDTSQCDSFILATAADKSLSLLSSTPPYDLIKRPLPMSDSPILSCVVIAQRFLLTTSMSGKLVLSDLKNGDILDERRDHQKYVVKVSVMTDTTHTWIATAAWDAKVLLYQLPKLDSDSQDVKLNAPLATLTLSSNPEAVTFIRHPEIATPVLLISRRDSTFLYYYTISESPSTSNTSQELVLLGRQNLAPHSNAWVAFTPSSFMLSPRDPLLLAVATSAVPHMKLIIVRLLLPPPPTSALATPVPAEANLTQATQARAELALADREAAAILIHATTLAPQTPYSTPDLAWRPDGTGVWVNGDDGVIRGMETTTGKIVTTLKDGHELGTKVRCVWAGLVGGEECVVSGGFDRRLVIWR
jgi:WD40 repeat protein